MKWNKCNNCEFRSVCMKYPQPKEFDESMCRNRIFITLLEDYPDKDSIDTADKFIALTQKLLDDAAEKAGCYDEKLER